MLPSGAVFFILIVAVLLASVLAWVVAGLYRRRMRVLMRGSAPTAPATPIQVADHPSAPGGRLDSYRATIDVAANHRAWLRLMLALSALSLLVALTQAALALRFVYGDAQVSLNRLLVLGAIYAWPMVLAWGLARRWSWLRILAAVSLYLLAMLVLVIVRSTPDQTWAEVSGWLFSQVAVPLTITVLIGASGRIRAVAPYLLPPTLLLIGSSVISLQLIAQDVHNSPEWIINLVINIGAYPTLLLLALAPWLLLAWPIFALGRRLADAYRNKRFSDLAYLIGIYWLLILFTSALPAMQSVGAIAFIQVLAWFWLPVGQICLRQPLKPPQNPPTLLVLRVFQRDAAVEKLFDQVIERWRLTGNTVLIAGTDVISHTLDPDELFAYLNGSLAKRFISSPAQVNERITALDWQPDPEGRYRINECFCFDATWQVTLDALVKQADVVLMDLRGFRPENLGCVYELGILSNASVSGQLRRIVIMYDQSTARAVAEAELHPDAIPHFRWLSAQQLNSATAKRVLQTLLALDG